LHFGGLQSAGWAALNMQVFKSHFICQNVIFYNFFVANVLPLRQADGQAVVKAEYFQKIIVTNPVYSVAATGNF
jgi:hypothetical protein